jgi:hypothetical protein
VDLLRRDFPLKLKSIDRVVIGLAVVLATCILVGAVLI